jgi:hypothetical protein
MLVQKVNNLSETFPGENLVVLRGVPVVSNGNVELALSNCPIVKRFDEAGESVVSQHRTIRAATGL